MKRVENLIVSLPQGAQAALIHDAANMRYYSGYTGEGLLVLAKDLKAIVTDFRYTEQAQTQAPGYEVLEITPVKGHNVVAHEALKQAGASIVAIEEDAITYAGYKALARELEGVTLVDLEGLPQRQRRIKDAEEADALARANALTSQTYEYILDYVRPGMTEKHIALELERYMIEHGAEAPSFNTIVASGPNGSLPHAVPSDRALQTGDLVTLDFGALVDGYCADMTRTFAMGAISDELRHIYETVQKAQALALAAAIPGAACKDVDAAARDCIYAAGFEGRFGHGLGHATGLQVHENPRCNTTSTDVLEPGMTMTIEPGIYVPGLGGVRIEDSILITPQGHQVLTPATKELVIVS